MVERDIATGFGIHYEKSFDEAAALSLRGIRNCMGRNRLGFRGAIVAEKGYDDGVWLYDSLRTFNDAILYCVGSEEAKDYLYAECPGSLGVIPFFARLQETEGLYAGNIPVAKYVPWTAYPPGFHRRHDIDYGGTFDHSYNPRKNHRDEVAANSIFVRSMHRYWKLFNDVSYAAKYYDVMAEYVEFRARDIDEETGLFRSTFGLADVAAYTAIPKSCALVYNNAECAQLFQEFSEIAFALQKEEAGETYQALARKMKDGINAHLWDETLKYYRVKIFSRIVSDEKHPFYGIADDNRFFVGDNITVLYHCIPDSRKKAQSLIAAIEKADGKLKLYGSSVTPPYPHGCFPQIMDNHNYWNGDIWPVRGTPYATALFRMGYPDRAREVLAKQVAVFKRDDGFYEYYEGDAEGKGKGAFNNCFSSSPYIAALVEGLFGLDPDYPNGIVHIHPSLRHSGSMRCQLGAHSFELGVTIDGVSGDVELSVDTTYSGAVDFRILLPDHTLRCHVHKDSERIPSHIERTGEAVYAVFASELDSGTTRFVVHGQPLADLDQP